LISVKDRAPLHPGRVQLNPVTGQPNIFDLMRADSPTEVGTALNRRTMQLLQADIRTLPIAAGNTVAAGDVVDVVGGEVVGSRKALSDLTAGDIVLLKESGVNVPFYVAKQDYVVNRTLLVRKDPLPAMAWDSSGGKEFSTSSIFTWLNGTYKNTFATDVMSSMVNTIWSYIKSSKQPSSFSAVMALLSPRECGVTVPASDVGSALPVANTLKTGYTQWTRTWDTSSGGQVYYINALGSYGATGSTATQPFRPAFTLPSNYVALYETSPSPSQAIALQSGTAGQSIDIIYDGVAELPGITAGTQITSAGVQGYAPQDGWLWVRPEWENNYGLKVVSGSYTGTGTTGASGGVTLTFDAPPKMVIIQDSNGNGSNGKVLVYTGVNVVGTVSVLINGNSLRVYTTQTSAAWIEQAMNTSAFKYTYIALFGGA
jgi:predicted RecA/RadA family phage recombinase